MKKVIVIGKSGSGIMIRSQLMTMTSTTAFDTASIAYAASLPRKTGSAISSPKHADAAGNFPSSKIPVSDKKGFRVFDSKTFSPPKRLTK